MDMGKQWFAVTSVMRWDSMLQKWEVTYYGERILDVEMIPSIVSSAANFALDANTFKVMVTTYTRQGYVNLLATVWGYAAGDGRGYAYDGTVNSISAHEEYFKSLPASIKGF